MNTSGDSPFVWPGIGLVGGAAVGLLTAILSDLNIALGLAAGAAVGLIAGAVLGMLSGER